MRWYRLGIALTFSLFSTPRCVPADLDNWLLRDQVLQQAGLEKAWSSAGLASGSRYRAQGVALHVSHTEQFKVIQVVTEDGGRKFFSPRDLGPDGQPVGDERAQWLADREMDRLKALGQTAQHETLEVPQVSLAVQSDSGALHLVDGENGRTLWAIRVGTPGAFTVTPAINDQYVAMSSGTQLYVFDRHNGKLLWQREAAGVPVKGLTLRENQLLFPTQGGTLETYGISEDRTAPWIYASLGKTAGPLTVVDMFGSWATDRGMLYVADLADRRVLYRFQAGSEVPHGAAATSDGALVFNSTDGFTYAINVRDGALRWHVLLGQSVRLAPTVVDDQVLVVTAKHNLMSISTATGQLQWTSGPVERILSVSAGRIYALAPFGRLVIIDRAGGTIAASIPLTPPDLPLTNTSTDRIYLVSSDGDIRCLRESGQRWPVVHQPPKLEELGKAEPPAATRPEPAPATSPTPPTETTPAIPDDFDGNPFEAPPPTREEPPSGE